MKKIEQIKVNRTKVIDRKYHFSTIIGFTGEVAKDINNHSSSIFILKCVCGNIFERSLNKIHINTNCDCIKRCRTIEYKKRGSYNPYRITSFNSVYGNYKSNAKYKKKVFELTKEEFRELTSRNCYYCGVEPKQELRLTTSKLTEEDGIYRYNGIDRINSSLGYTLENCVPCCEMCNKAKRDLSLIDFYSWIKRLLEYYGDGIK
jgi:hypothetical protein